MAYWRERDGEYTQFMRVGEHYTEVDDETLRRTVLHEMIHLFCYQKGYRDLSERSVMFTWLLGRLGASVSGIDQDNKKWQDLAKPFLDD
jgi:predicted SprT family Zn-dependent metalloprotease